MTTQPTPEELQTAWEQLQEIHLEYLAQHEVKIPQVTDYAANQKSFWLAVLYFWKDRKVHKDEISELARRDRPNDAADQQVRHLRADGWDIGQEKGVHQLNPFRPSERHANTHARRRNRLTATSFESIKKAFGYRCATCGAREGQPDPRYGGEPVKLQQGHQDPNKPGDNLENIIPQCQFCNRAYKGDFTFDDKGRAHAVADVGPVQRASKVLQEEIYQWLKNELQKDA